MCIVVRFHSVLSILSFLCKAPLVPRGTPLVNALFRQRACIDNILRACVGLAPINNMLLEYKHEKLVGQTVSEPVPCTVDDTLKLGQVHDRKIEPLPVVQQRAVKVNHHAWSWQYRAASCLCCNANMQWQWCVFLNFWHVQNCHSKLLQCLKILAGGGSYIVLIFADL